MPSPPKQPPPAEQLPPLDVSVIQEPDVPSVEPKALAELSDFEAAKRKLQLEDLQNEVKARGIYAGRLFWMMVVWLVIAVLFVLSDALTIPSLAAYGTFHLSDSVLITLITTTTATVVGVFLIVAKYLYRSRDSN